MYTTTEFLDHVKTRAAIPTSQGTYTNSRILSIGDSEIQSYIVPLLLKAREYHLAYDYSTSVNATGVYDIPSRAVGSKLINASLLDGTTILDLSWITEDALTSTQNTNSGVPGVFLKRNQLNLIPAVDHGYSTIRLTYSIRPGTLIETTAAAQITAIDTGTNTLTFASGSIPASWTTSNLFDLIQAKPHFDHLAIDQTAATITTTTMIFSSLPSRLVVGDWVALATQSPIVQVPADLHPLLEQKVANTLLRAQGDMEGYDRGRKELSEMEELTKALYTPRIETEGKKIVQNSGILRRC